MLNGMTSAEVRPKRRCAKPIGSARSSGRSVSLMVLKQSQITSDNGDKPVQIQGLGSKKNAAVVTV